MDPLFRSLSPSDVDDIRRHVRDGIRHCQALLARPNEISTATSKSVSPALLSVATRLGMPILHPETVSNVDICDWLGKRYRRLADDVLLLEGASASLTTQHNRRSILRVMYLLGIVLSVVVSAAMCQRAVVSSAAADINLGSVCSRTMRKLGRDPIAPFRRRGVFVDNGEENLKESILAQADDPDVLRRVRDALLGNKVRRTINPDIIVAVGGSATERERLLRSTEWFVPDHDSPSAVHLNTETVMELLPGFDALKHLGIIDQTPVTAADVAELYRTVADSIVKTLLRDIRKHRFSVLFSDDDPKWLAYFERVFNNPELRVRLLVIEPPDSTISAPLSGHLWGNFVNRYAQDYTQ